MATAAEVTTAVLGGDGGLRARLGLAGGGHLSRASRIRLRRRGQLGCERRALVPRPHRHRLLGRLRHSGSGGHRRDRHRPDRPALVRSVAGAGDDRRRAPDHLVRPHAVARRRRTASRSRPASRSGRSAIWATRPAATCTSRCTRVAAPSTRTASTRRSWLARTSAATWVAPMPARPATAGPSSWSRRSTSSATRTRRREASKRGWRLQPPRMRRTVALLDQHEVDVVGLQELQPVQARAFRGSPVDVRAPLAARRHRELDRLPTQPLGVRRPPTPSRSPTSTAASARCPCCASATGPRTWTASS